MFVIPFCSLDKSIAILLHFVVGINLFNFFGEKLCQMKTHPILYNE